MKRSIETAQKTIGGYFWNSNRRCQILKVDSFGGIPHFGFVTVDKEYGQNISGWMPVEFVDGIEITA